MKKSNEGIWMDWDEKKINSNIVIGIDKKYLEVEDIEHQCVVVVVVVDMGDVTQRDLQKDCSHLYYR